MGPGRAEPSICLLMPLAPFPPPKPALRGPATVSENKNCSMFALSGSHIYILGAMQHKEGTLPRMLLRAYRTQVTFGLVLLCGKMHPATTCNPEKAYFKVDDIGRQRPLSRNRA